MYARGYISPLVINDKVLCDFCPQVWLALADNYLNGLCIDWEKTKTLAFNRKSNPDDNKLDLQIVKVRNVSAVSTSRVDGPS